MEEKRWKVLVLLLKEIAKERNITQKQIAAKTNLRQGQISGIFNLNHIPQFDTFVKICSAIGITFTFKVRDGEKIDFKRLIRLAKANYK